MTTLSQEEFKQKYGTIGLEKFGIRQPEKSYLGKVVSNIGETFKGGAKEIISDVGKTKSTAESIAPLNRKAGAIEYGLSGLKTLGNVAGTIGETAGGLIGSFIEPLLSDDVKDTVGSVIRYVDDAIDVIPGMTPEIKKSLGDVFAVATLEGGGKLSKMGENVAGKTISGVKTGVKNVTGAVAEKLPQSLKYVTEKIPQSAKKVVKWFASEPSEQVKTILKETSTKTFDDYLKVVKESIVDPRKQSVFEKVGEKLSNATKQLKRQADSIAIQKSQIIQKAKVGLDEFLDAPRQAILKVMRLEENPLKNKILTELKGIKTKLDADKAIDNIQSLIYDAKGTGIIAQGSAIEKQLRGIIGEMNNSLKETLPSSYSVLNTKYADRIRAVSTLNKALGEVVEGTPIRGASLIKQFFSPAGSKSKELFEFIKKSTGIDLAQDATVAKFLGEVFEDPKVRSLLEGNIPTSKAGLLKKGLDIFVEKSSLGKKAKEVYQTGQVEKAKGFMK